MTQKKQVTRIYFFHYKGFRSKVYGFRMMQFGHSKMLSTNGLSFYKLMGSGRGDGFNPWPDFSTYCLLCVFEDEASANQFNIESPLLIEAKEKCSRVEIFSLRSIKSHGMWSGINPFKVDDQQIETNQQIVVLTRATIKLKYLYRFWKYVPISSKPIKNNPDVLFTKGVGEIPVIQMATLSIWKNLEAVKSFAYNSKEHTTAIKMTRKLSWYREELFARFILLDRQELI